MLYFLFSIQNHVLFIFPYDILHFHSFVGISFSLSLLFRPKHTYFWFKYASWHGLVSHRTLDRYNVDRSVRSSVDQSRKWMRNGSNIPSLSFSFSILLAYYRKKGGGGGLYINYAHFVIYKGVKGQTTCWQQQMFHIFCKFIVLPSLATKDKTSSRANAGINVILNDNSVIITSGGLVASLMATSLVVRL